MANQEALNGHKIGCQWRFFIVQTIPLKTGSTSKSRQPLQGPGWRDESPCRISSKWKPGACYCLAYLHFDHSENDFSLQSEREALAYLVEVKWQLSVGKELTDLLPLCLQWTGRSYNISDWWRSSPLKLGFINHMSKRWPHCLLISVRKRHFMN